MALSTKITFRPSTKPDAAMTMTSSGPKENSASDTKSTQNSENFIRKEDDYRQERDPNILKQKLEAQMADWRRQSDGVREFLRLSGIR
jgi:hypothetical protein